MKFSAGIKAVTKWVVLGVLVGCGRFGFDPSDSPVDGAPSNALSYSQEVLNDSPQLYWRFREPAGSSVARDASGHGRDGTYRGPVVLEATGALRSDADSAVRLDGTTSTFVELGDVFDFGGLAPFSVEAWIRLEQSDGAAHTICAKTHQGIPVYHLFVQSDTLKFQRERQSTWQGAWQPAFTMAAFHHVVGTFDGVVIRLYVDGAPISSVNSDLLIEESAEALFAGRYIQGELDEFAIYDYALGADRIAAHFYASELH